MTANDANDAISYNLPHSAHARVYIGKFRKNASYASFAVMEANGEILPKVLPSGAACRQQ